MQHTYTERWMTITNRSLHQLVTVFTGLRFVIIAPEPANQILFIYMWQHERSAVIPVSLDSHLLYV